MASLSEIPQELVAKIVGELRDDAPSLRASALVSRVFLPWSRLHLFSSVRLTPRNVYAFRTLVAPYPAVAMYVRRLDIPLINNDLPSSALLPPESFVQLPNVTQLAAHGDPFGFRQLSTSQRAMLGRAMQYVTTVHIRVLNHFWTLGEWASLLNGCLNLTQLDIHAESTGGFLTSLHTLSIDVLYVRNDYDLPDERPALVLAAAPTLREMTLPLDPPMPLVTPSHTISVASFPKLRGLHLKDGEDAIASESFDWLNEFLRTGLVGIALQEICIEHGMIQRDIIEVPAATWHALESTLLRANSEPGSRFARLTFRGYNRFSLGSPDTFRLFGVILRDCMPGLDAAGMLYIMR